MALVPYLKWLGAAMVVLAVVWVLARRVASPVKRLAMVFPYEISEAAAE